MKCLHSCGLGLLLLIWCYQVESLMWNNRPSGTGNWGQNKGQWDSRYTGWNTNSGQYDNSWAYPTGNNKGYRNRQCYDRRHCYQSECCQISGYSRSGVCVHNPYASSYGCSNFPHQDPIPERPVYPGNNKGGSIRQIGKPGSCPSFQPLRGPTQYCRQDDHCPTSQKCCYAEGQYICMYPIFA